MIELYLLTIILALLSMKLCINIDTRSGIKEPTVKLHDVLYCCIPVFNLWCIGVGVYAAYCEVRGYNG